MHQRWYRKLFPRPQTLPPEPKADQGDADAQFSLGQELDRGGVTAAEEVQAVKWYRKAAMQDHALAQFNLGMMLAVGRGAVRDDTEARQWILQAAKQGHAAAQHDLGVRCRRASFEADAADTVEANVEAYKWFGLAAAQGHRGSMGEFENLAVRMTGEQVSEGDQRIASFVAHSPTPKRAEEPCGPPLKV